MKATPDRSRATAFGLIKEESGAYPVGHRSALDRLESDEVIAELAPELVALIPEPPPESRRPRAATPSERAELVIEDLSLAADNPYLASSLVPPPKRPFPARRAVAIACGMLAAAGLGATLQLVALRGGPDVSGHRPQASAGVQAPAPVAVASPREVIAPPAPVVPVAAALTPVAAPAPDNDLVSKAVDSAAEGPASVKSSRPVMRRDAPPAPVEPPSGVAAPRPPAPQPAAPSATPEPLAASSAPSVEPAQVPAAVDLPAFPSREQVNEGFEAVRAALSQCAAGRSGTVEIRATINSNGRIGHALVTGDFNGSAEGSCMAKAVREAQFPPFAEPRLKVRYPFAL